MTVPAALQRVSLVLIAAAFLATIVGCGGATQDAAAPEAPAEAPAEVTEVVIASTTSTEDSGLFEVLLPAFTDANPEFRASVVAVGTGQALEIGRAKDADVVFVHSKADEEKFVAEGYGYERRDVMYNDFVIVGPESDPAGIAGGKDVAAALAAISQGGHTFVSRGDDSGTHKAELRLWKAAEIEPAGEWYKSIGQGMGDTLTMTSEVAGYTLTDRGTFLSMRDGLELAIAVEGDERLFNQYGVIVVTDASNADGAQAFFDWVVSAEAQAIIGEFGVDKFGEPLFVPNAK
ncbi:MAG: extracellular solute-binding protein [Clostridiales bacterium]|nr:extracellular solute-binding protein [Clostridiales bacterium]